MWDFDAVAYESDHYCVGCLPDGVTPEDEFVYAITAIAELDSYPVCCVCQREHDYMGLTTDGQRWRSRREWSDKVRHLAEGTTDGKLPAFAWPGGYPVAYSDDGDCFCPACANDTDKQLSLTDYGVHWEGDPLTCDECGDEIPSAYGPVPSDE